MTDKPILFSAPMVQAILREIREPGAGKTQTRRILPQSHPKFPHHNHLSLDVLSDPSEVWFWDGVHDRVGASYRLPFHPGMRLWVRETWREWHDVDANCGCSDHCACSPSTAHPAAYRADGGELTAEDREAGLKWKPSIFMPRWASRITLDVTRVRIQRLQEISGADAAAEGCQLDRWITGNYPFFDPGVEADNAALVTKFRTIWDSLNADRAPWASNPWVVVVSFRPHLTNIDQMEAVA